MSLTAYEQNQINNMYSELRIIRSMISHLVPEHSCDYGMHDFEQAKNVCVKCGRTRRELQSLTTASNAGEAAQGAEL